MRHYGSYRRMNELRPIVHYSGTILQWVLGWLGSSSQDYSRPMRDYRQQLVHNWPIHLVALPVYHNQSLHTTKKSLHDLQTHTPNGLRPNRTQLPSRIKSANGGRGRVRSEGHVAVGQVSLVNVWSGQIESNCHTLLLPSPIPAFPIPSPQSGWADTIILINSLTDAWRWFWQPLACGLTGTDKFENSLLKPKSGWTGVDGLWHVSSKLAGTSCFGSNGIRTGRRRRITAVDSGTGRKSWSAWLTRARLLSAVVTRSAAWWVTRYYSRCTACATHVRCWSSAEWIVAIRHSGTACCQTQWLTWAALSTYFQNNNHFKYKNVTIGKSIAALMLVLTSYWN